MNTGPRNWDLKVAISLCFAHSTVLFAFLLLSSCIQSIPPSSSFDTGETIRIAVLKGINKVTIEGRGTVTVDGSSISVESNPLLFEFGDTGLFTLNGAPIAGASATFIPENEFFLLNGRRFRGALEVLKGQKGLLVVNELSLELYIAGLINHEISSKWPMDAVKAQAIIARTYALYQKKKRTSGAFHLEGTVADQVYAGSTTEDDRSFHAVQETRGEALTYNGELALTLYHSNSGGMTEDSRNVWGKDYPYLRQVKSPFDEAAPNFSWELNMAKKTLEASLQNAGYLLTDIEEIALVNQTPSNRVTQLLIRNSIGDISMSGEELRKIIGYDKLKSTLFTIENSGDFVVFRGKGSGHGVGLSQWGAKGMAEKGYTYREILEHYYPGTSLEKIY